MSKSEYDDSLERELPDGSSRPTVVEAASARADTDEAFPIDAQAQDDARITWRARCHIAQDGVAETLDPIEGQLPSAVSQGDLAEAAPHAPQNDSEQAHRGAHRSVFQRTLETWARQARSWHLLLWSAHQNLIAIAVGGSLLAMAGYFGFQAYFGSGLIEIDQASKIEFEFQVDLNRAPWYELFAIPGIGETLARRIVDYRQEHGEFESIDELAEVPGLGPKTVDRVRRYLLPIRRSERTESTSSIRSQQPVSW